jgi:two-component system sensor histidine kinase YesM
MYNEIDFMRGEAVEDMKAWRMNRLRNKLIAFLLVSVILPISISILITYQYTKESIKSDYIRENTNLIHQGAINIQNYMERINEATLLIYNDLSDESSLFQLIQKSNHSWLEEREMYRNLQFIANSVKDIEQIYLYSSATDTSFRFANNLLRSAPGQSYDPEMEQERDVRIDPAHPSHEYGIGRPKFLYHIEREVLSFHRKITDIPNADSLGFITLDVKTDTIRELGGQLYSPGNEELYIVDDRGNFIYASASSVNDGADAETDDWVTGVLNAGEPQSNYHYKDARFSGIHIYERIVTPWMEWTLVKRIPYESLYEDARRITMINSLVVSFFLILSVIATVYISVRFTNPIKQLIRYINKIESGRLDADIDVNRNDEIGILAKRFHQLMQRLDQLITREYRLELANKTNQLKALQAQVNPHFLNNALQSIGTLALQHGDRKIYSLISSLGKMMRYHMKADGTSVPLSAELDYVRSYLELQRQRFDENLTFDIAADEQARAVQVPKMILQPIVENVFKHGFPDTKGPWVIEIDCQMAEPDVLEIRVGDNGVGIGDETRERLQAMLDRGTNPFEAEGRFEEGIGLYNILSRLRLYFSEQARLRLLVRPAGGLDVILSIPLTKGAPNAHESLDR